MKSNTIVTECGLILAIAACGACSTRESGDSSEDAGVAASDVAADASPNGTCPSAPGPTMARVPWPAQKGGGYCIDSTEVTREQYALFVEANVAAGTQEPKCAWNTSFVPDSSCMQNVTGTPSPNLPQTCVDWCDAQAFCRWAGKRLCAGTPENMNESTVSEWYNACSAGGTRLRPYGDDFKPYCNVRLSSNGTVLLDVGANPQCEGGYPGVLDMLGNAQEWTDECAALSQGGDACWARGSSFQRAWPMEVSQTDARDNPTCQQPNFNLYSPNVASIGANGSFRCCADEMK